MKTLVFCILSDDAMLMYRPPWVRGYRTFDEAVREHVDYKQSIHQIFAEPIGDGKYQLEENTWAQRIKWPVVKEADYTIQRGVLDDDAWGHRMRRKVEEVELEALVYVPKDEDKFSFHYGNYNFDVTKFEVVEEFPLWNLVEVTEYDWWS